METSTCWCLMEVVSGQTDITGILHIIQVYLKMNTIRIIMTTKCD